MTGSGSGDMPGRDLDPLVQVAPIGIVVVDETCTILLANSYARALIGCAPGEVLGTFVHQDDRARFDGVVRESESAVEVKLGLDLGSRTVEMRSSYGDREGHRVIFVTDVSERVALGRQLQSSRQPSRKLLYQLHAAATAMSGYAELIDLMLEEEPIVSGERLNVIRRYHREVRQNLDTMARLLKIEREGGRKPDSAAIPIRRKQVVVIDDEAAIAEYIAELMRALNFRVSAFTSAEEALSFLVDNAASIDLVIVDDGMSIGERNSFSATLLDVPATFPVVLCAGRDAQLTETSRTYLCHKPIDISELTRIVSDLIQD